MVCLSKILPTRSSLLRTVAAATDRKFRACCGPRRLVSVPRCIFNRTPSLEPNRDFGIGVFSVNVAICAEVCGIATETGCGQKSRSLWQPPFVAKSPFARSRRLIRVIAVDADVLHGPNVVHSRMGNIGVESERTHRSSKVFYVEPPQRSNYGKQRSAARPFRWQCDEIVRGPLYTCSFCTPFCTRARLLRKQYVKT